MIDGLVPIHTMLMFTKIENFFNDRKNRFSREVSGATWRHPGILRWKYYIVTRSLYRKNMNESFGAALPPTIFQWDMKLKYWWLFANFVAL